MITEQGLMQWMPADPVAILGLGVTVSSPLPGKR
jgi:hypothetical protein